MCLSSQGREFQTKKSYHLLTAQQEPYKKACLLIKENWRTFSIKKKSQQKPVLMKNIGQRLVKKK